MLRDNVINNIKSLSNLDLDNQIVATPTTSHLTKHACWTSKTSSSMYYELNHKWLLL